METPLSIDTSVGVSESDGVVIDEPMLWSPSPHPKSPKQLGELLRNFAREQLGDDPLFTPPGEPVAGKMSRVYRTADRLFKIIDPCMLLETLVEREMRVDKSVLRYADTLLTLLTTDTPAIRRLVGHSIEGLVGVRSVERVTVEKPYPHPAIRLELEPIDGVSFSEYLSTRKPELATRRRLFGQLLTTVDQLLADGFYHRDLRIANLMVELRAGDLEPKLRLIDLDFATEVDPTAYPIDLFYVFRRLLPKFDDPELIRMSEPLLVAWSELTLWAPFSTQDEFWQLRPENWALSPEYRARLTDWRTQTCI